MDNSHHQWFNQAAAGRNGYNNDNNVGNNRVDLTLKLGLPDCDYHQNPLLYQQVGQCVNPASMASNHLPNLSFAGSNTQEGMNQLGMVNQGAMAQAQQSFNASQYAWPSDRMTASNVHNVNYANAVNQFSGSSMGFPSSSSTNSYSNFAPTHDQHQLLPSPVPMNSYTLIDVPPRRRTDQRHDFGSSSSGSGRRARRQRGGNYNDPNKRCTNYNCNTNDTPMWRKGPLGPKTLCNACGIKYRKEEEKRRTKEAGSMAQQSNPNG